MMTLTHTVGDAEIRFTPPSTARDVLDWTVWIAVHDTADSIEDTARNALVWAAQWTEHSAEELDALLAEHAENAFVALVGLCNAMAEAAGIPQDVQDSMAKMLRRRTASREGWAWESYERFRPEGACSCTRCRSAMVGTQIENAAGEQCVFDDIDPRALMALRASDIEHPDEPLYMAHVRNIVAAEESRRWQYERHLREAHGDYKNKLADKGIMRRDH